MGSAGGQEDGRVRLENTYLRGIGDEAEETGDAPRTHLIPRDPVPDRDDRQAHAQVPQF